MFSKIFNLLFGLDWLTLSFGGGGGGGPTSTTSTVTQTNIPEYARPYVETMMGAGQKELFNYAPDASGNLVPTGLKPYTPYSTDMNAYVAGFSPMQQQAFQGAANLQMPGQFGTATGLSEQAGLGGLSTAGMATGLAGQQAGAGAQYAQQATSPGAMQAYMSPYMQNVVDVQQQQAQRQADIAQQAQQAKFAQMGAFGGSAQAIAGQQAAADLMRQKQAIQAQGSQQAFQQAQQAQQFGAQLGLQGLAGAQQGVQNALAGYGLMGQMGGQLGQLGTQQLAAQQGILGTQAQMGAQQQAAEQQKINQAIQNYAMQQQYPMQQLGQMNALLRGLPLSSNVQSMYQAPPSLGSQLAGTATAAYGMSQLPGRAKGGKIEEKKPSGLQALALYNMGR